MVAENWIETGGSEAVVASDATDRGPIAKEALPAFARRWEWVFPEREFRKEVRLRRESEGGYSVYVPDLPGAVTEGETESEALENIKDALQALIDSYRDAGQEVPWRTELPEETESEIIRWVVVNA